MIDLVRLVPRKILIVVGILVLASAWPTSSPAISPTDTFTNAVRYRILVHGTPVSQCTGTLLAGGFILTARHCVEPEISDLASYNRAVPRSQILGEIRHADRRLEIEVFGHAKLHLNAAIAAIGAGTFDVEEGRGQQSSRLVAYDQGPDRINAFERLDIGMHGDWVLLAIGARWAAPCVKTQNAVPTSVFAVGSEKENLTTRPANLISLSEALDRRSRDPLNQLTREQLNHLFAKTGFMNNEVTPGYSGGAVVTPDGTDLGVISSVSSRQGYSMFAPLDEIRAQIETDRAVDPALPDLHSAFCD